MENILLTALRLLVPLSILKWPFAGTFASVFIDLKDWEWFRFETVTDYAFYHRWDKLLDLYYLSFAAYMVRFWKDRVAYKISLMLFGFRAVGIVLFVLTQSQALLFVFPNVFENMFLFYLAYVRLTKHKKLFSSFGTIALVLFAVGVPKIAQEYIMHVMKTQGFFDEVLITAGIPPTYSFSFRMVLYLCVPVVVLIWLARRTRQV